MPVVLDLKGVSRACETPILVVSPHHRPPPDSVICCSWFRLSICIPVGYPGDVDAADLGNHS